MTQGARRRDEFADLRQKLAAAAVDAGGWPYYAGQARRLEPTCWALLALSAAAPAQTGQVAAGWQFLRGLQRQSGLLVEAATPGANFAWNGLALLASTVTSPKTTDIADWRGRLVEALLAAKGIALEGPSPVRQNSRLQAWPWTEGTFSWIEPTAFCVLALKKAEIQGSLAAARLTEAERLMLDRVCDTGGWNYGNSQVLGQDLRPYVPTTALALLALQDRKTHPAVTKSLEWLLTHATSERSAMALALSAVCLHAFGQPTTALRPLLVEQYAKTEFLGNAHLLAMAFYALTLPGHDGQAFVVAG
jgi:hypothetical protein